MFTHAPVLLEEALAGLGVREDGRYLDATFGRGGHTGAILRCLGERGRVVALDRDPQAIEAGRRQFAHEQRLLLIHAHFGQLGVALRETGMNEGFDGALFDLGVSSPQLDDASRGFSFSQDGPLDMRMDTTAGLTAADWLARVSERNLVRTISTYGEERYAQRIARAIVARRREQRISTTVELAQLVADAVPGREPGKHPATRTFQAIRIAVNSELEQLEQALQQSLAALAPHGRLCVISFHSLEDGIVKRFMQRQSREDPVYAGLPEVPPHARPKLRRIGRAVHPSQAEVARNPRARSAVMRIAERLAA